MRVRVNKADLGHAFAWRDMRPQYGSAIKRLSAWNADDVHCRDIRAARKVQK